ncbi:MAG: general secretion pathway protein GspK [Lentisphaerae bacterium]|nr:general secretion pathway protein GspK [Lentisphaerota bacterium]
MDTVKRGNIVGGRMAARQGARSRGSALIIVLWTIGLMGLLVMSFAFDAHLEAKIISYYRKRTRAGYLAQSGIEIAKLLMAKVPHVDPRAPPEPDPEDPWKEDARQLAAGGRLQRAYPLGDGDVQVEIVTEQARRSVNTLKREEDWEPILDAIGVPEDMWPDLVDAFLDWTDADDEARPNGAETEDYYKTLKPPYRARNGDLYSVEELLQIKGFNRAILYGGPLTAGDEEPVMIADGGLSRLLTVFGTDPKVNINAAPYEVLMTLPSSRGDNDLVAEDVLEERASLTNVSGLVEDNYFLDDADMFRRLPLLGEGERRNYVTTVSSKYYRITSRGRVQNVERKVWCIVEINGEVMTILRWIEED